MQLLQVLTLTQRQLIQVQVLRLWREISVVAWVLSWNQRHIWLESVVASRPCSESSTMYRPPQNQHSKSQFYPENIQFIKLCLYLFDYETRRARPSQALAFVINAVFLLSSFLLFFFFSSSGLNSSVREGFMQWKCKVSKKQGTDCARS